MPVVLTTARGGRCMTVRPRWHGRASPASPNFAVFLPAFYFPARFFWFLPFKITMYLDIWEDLTPFPFTILHLL